MSLLALGACTSDPGPVALLGGPDPGGSGGASGGRGGAGQAGAAQAGAGQAGSAAQSGSGAGQAGTAGQGGAAAGQAGASGQGGVAGQAGAAGQGGGAACLGALDGVAVAPVDLHGWPPYAVSGCRALYVRGDGALVLADGTSGTEEVVAPASDQPRRPALSGSTYAWEVVSGGVARVRARQQTGAVVEAAGAFHHAREPRVADGVLVFTAFAGADDLSDSDVYSLDLATSAVTLIAGGPGQQRWPDVSVTHVAWSDFSEDPDGRLDGNDTDVCDVVVASRAALGAPSRLSREGKQAFPQLDGASVVFLDWPAVHPEPKLQHFGLRVWQHAAPAPQLDQLVADVSHDAAAGETHVRPAVLDGVVAWVGRDSTGASRVFTSSTSTPSPSAVSGFSSAAFAPTLTATHVLAATGSSSAPTLSVVAR